MHTQRQTDGALVVCGLAWLLRVSESDRQTHFHNITLCILSRSLCTPSPAVTASVRPDHCLERVCRSRCQGLGQFDFDAYRRRTRYRKYCTVVRMRTGTVSLYFIQRV